jgi:hypothetical protein
MSPKDSSKDSETRCAQHVTHNNLACDHIGRVGVVCEFLELYREPVLFSNTVKSFICQAVKDAERDVTPPPPLHFALLPALLLIPAAHGRERAPALASHACNGRG